jgi:hypothetical protein
VNYQTDNELPLLKEKVAQEFLTLVSRGLGMFSFLVRIHGEESDG